MQISSGSSGMVDPYRISYHEDAEKLRSGGVYQVDGVKGGNVTLDTRYNTVKVHNDTNNQDKVYSYNPLTGELKDGDTVVADADNTGGTIDVGNVNGMNVSIHVQRGLVTGGSDVLSFTVADPRGNGGNSTLTLQETFTCNNFPKGADTMSDLDVDCNKDVTGKFTGDDDSDPKNGTLAAQNITFADERGGLEKLADGFFSFGDLGWWG